MKEIIQVYDCKSCRQVNAELAGAILSLPDDAFNKRTHLFHGRYENLYIDAERLPGLSMILDEGMRKASEILRRPVGYLKLGFWLNIMRKGDVTTLHRHDDDDELLSAVYYVQVPPGSADFRLHQQGEVTAFKPVEGRFMFFDPALPHEVGEHEPEEVRISIGINFGPIDKEEP